MNKVNIIIAGVGGQGNLLVAALIAKAALAEGLVARRSEIKGLAQRGGPVQSLVRVGKQVWSPLIEQGTADLLLGLDPVEALRYIQFLAPTGKAITSSNFAPNPVSFSQEEILEKARERGFLLVPANDLAKRAGNVLSANIVLLGAASPFFPFPPERFRQVIRDNVKRFLEENLKAFELGREVIATQ
jgi:indolepyruvate ferredoxin oxidoreductase beta subunit